MAKETKSEYPVLTFATQAQWRNWLVKNHTKLGGVWLRFYKKGSGKKTFSYAEALDEALCFGWIDGQANKYDEQSYLQKFTPRRKRSVWSKRNREHITRLIKEKRMHAAGIGEVGQAKKDGRWDRAYDSPKNMKVPADLLKEFKKDRKAEAFFGTLNKANLYAIAWRLQTAKKPETRTKRMQAIIVMMKQGKKFH